MSNRDDGGPAFPRKAGWIEDYESGGQVYIDGSNGVSLRDYFAGYPRL